MRKLEIFVPLLLALSAKASAEPKQLSQHPRVGELCEIDFSRDSSRLPLDVGERLGEVAAWARENPTGLVVLDGHADRTARPAADTRLSLRRAEAVRDELIVTGVDPDQIVIAAFGGGGPRRGDNHRVVVWGTRQGIEKVAASRTNADALVWGRETVNARAVAGR